jgi:hypothetical protein
LLVDGGGGERIASVAEQCSGVDLAVLVAALAATAMVAAG